LTGFNWVLVNSGEFARESFRNFQSQSPLPIKIKNEAARRQMLVGDDEPLKLLQQLPDSFLAPLKISIALINAGFVRR
jgi:hypothetical protein